MKAAHEYCFNKFKTAMNKGASIIVVDNTNIKLKHFRSYLDYTIRDNIRNFNIAWDYKIKIVEPKTWWKWNSYQLYKRNTHGVPIETIKRNLKNWDNILFYRKNRAKQTYEMCVTKLPRRLCTLWQRIMNFLN